MRGGARTVHAATLRRVVGDEKACVMLDVALLHIRQRIPRDHAPHAFTQHDQLHIADLSSVHLLNQRFEDVGVALDVVGSVLEVQHDDIEPFRAELPHDRRPSIRRKMAAIILSIETQGIYQIKWNGINSFNEYHRFGYLRIVASEPYISLALAIITEVRDRRRDRDGIIGQFAEILASRKRCRFTPFS